MKNKPEIKLHLGKRGLTEDFINGLKNAFKTRRRVKIKVLKSLERDREKIKELADKIIEELGENYRCKVIGFTIKLKKEKKNRFINNKNQKNTR